MTVVFILIAGSPSGGQNLYEILITMALYRASRWRGAGTTATPVALGLSQANMPKILPSGLTHPFECFQYRSGMSGKPTANFSNKSMVFIVLFVQLFAVKFLKK